MVIDLLWIVLFMHFPTTVTDPIDQTLSTSYSTTIRRMRRNISTVAVIHRITQYDLYSRVETTETKPKRQKNTTLPEMEIMIKIELYFVLNESTKCTPNTNTMTDKLMYGSFGKSRTCKAFLA
jgi:hypothetical protein